MKAKVLITGASGLLGRNVLRQFQKSTGDVKWTCVGLCHSRVRDNLVACDLTNFQFVNDLVQDLKVWTPIRRFGSWYLILFLDKAIGYHTLCCGKKDRKRRK